MQGKIVVNKSRFRNILKIVLFLIPFFQPGCFLYMNIKGIECATIFNLLKILSALAFIVVEKFRINTFSKNESRLILLIFLFGFFISVSSFVHTDSLTEFSTFFSFTILCIICLHYLNNRENEFISALVILFGAYNILELITVILYYPNGIFNYTGGYWEQTLARAKYFLGGKNQAIFCIISFLVCMKLKNVEKTKTRHSKFVFYFIAIIFVMELYVLDSTASIICLFLFLILNILMNSNIRTIGKWIFNPYIWMIASVVFFLVVCILGNAESIPFLSEFLVLFGRNTTFTNRIYIWGIALEYFRANPLLGVGEITFMVMGNDITQAHNMYLDYMFKYGGLAAMVYFIILLKSTCNLSSIVNFQNKAILVSAFFVMLIHNCFDAMDNYMFILYSCLFVHFSILNRQKGG